MIVKSCKVLSTITFRFLGWAIILVATLKLMLPFFLPITLNDVWVEKVVKSYFQDVKIGSVHIVINDGKLAFLLQNVDTPSDAAQGIHVTRAYISPAIFKSIVGRKWVFNKIKLYAGELHMGFGTGYIRLGAIKIPIHPDQPLPIWVHNLSLRHIKVHLDEIPELSEVYIHDVQLLNPKHKGQLKAWITEDGSRRASVKVIFDFEKHQDDILGKLYVKGYDHKLIRLFQVLRWPGADVNGKADFEFWADVDKGRIQSAVFDLKGHDLTLSKKHGELFIDKMNGRLAYDYKAGLHRWQGQNVKLHLGKSKLDTEFLLTSPDFKSYTLKGKSFDIGLIHYIVQDVPQVKNFFQSFDLLPEGNIPYVKMTFDQGMVKPTSVLMEAQNLSFTQNELSVLGLDGRLHYVDGEITSQLKGEELTFSQPNVFSGPIFLSTYELNGTYDLKRAKVSVAANATQNQHQLKGDMELFLQDKPILGFNLHAPYLTVQRVKDILPVKKMKPTLSTWLDKSLVEGTITNLTFSYLGLLDEFAHPNNPNPFKLKADLNDAVLDYASPWPTFKKLNASLEIGDHQLSVEGQGLFDGAIVKHVKATIDDMRPTPSVLKVSADFESDLEYGWQAIAKANLINASTFESLNMHAPMALTLNLAIPLIADSKTKVDGRFKFSDGSLKLASAPWVVEKTQGELEFNNDRITSEMLEGELLGHRMDTHLNIDLSSKHKLELAMHTQLDIGEMTKEVIQGQAPISATLDWPFDSDNATYTGIVNVNQLGFEAHSDSFKDKPQAIHFAGNIFPQKAFDLKVDWGQLAHAQFNFDQSSDSFEPTLALIELGKKKKENRPEKGWHLLGHLPSFVLEDWLPYAELFRGEHGTQALALDLTFDDFIANEIHLKNVSLKGNRKENTQHWLFDMDSAKLAGHADIDLAEKKPWSLQLDHLFLAKTKSTEREPIQLPRRPLRVKIKQFETNFAKGHNFNLNLVPNDNGYIVDDFSFNTDYSKFDISGVWANQELPHHVKLAGKIETRDIQDVLTVFGKKSSLREAKGQIHFDMAYKGELHKPDLNSIRGQGEVELKSGVVLGINPGIGRILSLLNLDTLRRRLAFDFSDVTKEGFAFDTLEGRFNVGHGHITTDNLRLEAPTANIEFYGDMGLGSHQVQAQVTVMPNVTGALPLAVAIAAGNPAIGAAVWLMDKVFGPKIQEMTRYNYVVSGTIDSPDVKEITDGKNTMTRR